MSELPAGAIVTGVVPDARHRDAVRIEVAGKVLLTVPAASAAGLRIGPGTVLEPSLYTDLCRAADAEGAYRAALICLGRRPFSRRDLARRLVMRGHPPEAADRAVARAEAAGLVNDETYARHYIQTRSARGRGPLRLRRELAVLGVPAAIADRVLAEETGEESDSRVVAALARKRAGQLEGVERHDRIRRVTAFLARRGYVGPEVRRVVRETIAHQGVKA